MCSLPYGGAGDPAERFGGKHRLWQSCAWDQLSQVRRNLKLPAVLLLSFKVIVFAHSIWHTLSPQVRLQHHSEGGDADFNPSGAGVPFPAAGPTAHPITICGSAPACKYAFVFLQHIHVSVEMIEINILNFVSLLCLCSSQLLKKWAPVFKNYVKRAQDHLDCLSAFEEHFLEQESHWAAMVKVRVNQHSHATVILLFTLRSLSLDATWCWRRCDCFSHPGPDEHVPAGDPGGGDDTALVLPGSHHRQEQTAPQEPGGRYRASWVTQDTRLYDSTIGL